MDLVDEKGVGFLGSRLKRFGERLQAGAARITADAGIPVQPAHMAYLSALEDGSLSIGQLVQRIGVAQPGVTRAIGQLVQLGMVTSRLGADQRQRSISLTDLGLSTLTRAKVEVWPRVERAVQKLLGDNAESFMKQISELEAALAQTPLDVLAARSSSPALIIRDYSGDLDCHFTDINSEWITSMFQLEDADRKVLENPRETIIEAGGAILFVEASGLGIVGTGALQRASDGGLELTKMGVRESARGLGAGEFLLAALIERANAFDAEPFFLLTNARCAAAILLYEKLGFRHDVEIMTRYGARYERCDVAMRYVPGNDTSQPST